MNRTDLRRLSSFGGAMGADAYVFSPTTNAEIIAALTTAKEQNRRVVLRGAGRSYGDASILAESVAIDMTRYRAIIAFDSKSGVIHVQSGVTLDMIWKRALPEGWWPPVVSGTANVTVGGTIAMNIHGKNQFKVGDFGEHVVELEVMDSNGNVHALTPDDDNFWAVIGGAGILGIVLSAKIQLARVPGGVLSVKAARCRDWADQFRCFEHFETEADYMVSWVDAFGGGRGLFHAANYQQAENVTFGLDYQSMSPRVAKLFPKDQLWRIMRIFTNRAGMRYVNAVKFLLSSGAAAGNLSAVKSHEQTLAEFSFLLDSAPNWERAYDPASMIQFQSFVPAEAAKSIFPSQISRLASEQLEPFLAVMKRHREDRGLLRHSVDGYSLALDLKVTEGNSARLHRVLNELTDDVLSAGGRFYLAKDSVLTGEQFLRSVGTENWQKFCEIRSQMDPDGRFGSALFDRITTSVPPAKPDAESPG